MKKATILFFLSVSVITATAQGYTAISGSSYTGSLNVHNNPASIANSPFKWDVTIFGVQDKQSTNIINILDYSLISNPAKSKYLIASGDFSRFGKINFNGNLLNTNISLGKYKSIAFGANVRGYANIKSSRYNYYDTVAYFSDFFSLNGQTKDIVLNHTSSAFAEIYGSYAQTIFDNGAGRLNAGIAMKVSKGLASSFLKLENGNFRTVAGTNPQEYEITNADLLYGYSSNFDLINKNNSAYQNRKNFFNSREGGASVDIGFEYIIKPQGVISSAGEDDFFDYDWKIGLSVLDIGFSQYKYGNYNRYFKGSPIPNTTDLVLDKKFDSTITNIQTFTDSLITIVNFPQRQAGKYKVYNPARVVVNADRFIADAFFINAELSIDVSKIVAHGGLYVSDMSVFTLTPRWETYKKGFYMPIHYNSNNQLWVGGAVKIGPVLFGVHNLANLVSKKKMNRGGGYLAIVLHSKGTKESKRDKRLDCPK